MSPSTRCGSSCWCCRVTGRSRAPLPGRTRPGCSTPAAILLPTSSGSCSSATTPGTGWSCCWGQTLSEYSYLRDFSTWLSPRAAPPALPEVVNIYFYYLFWFINCWVKPRLPCLQRLGRSLCSGPLCSGVSPGTARALWALSRALWW